MTKSTIYNNNKKIPNFFSWIENCFCCISNILHTNLVPLSTSVDIAIAALRKNYAIIHVVPRYVQLGSLSKNSKVLIIRTDPTIRILGTLFEICWVKKGEILEVFFVK